MKNSSEKKKSQTRSSLMKTIGNGNNVSYGVNLTSASSFFNQAIGSVLIRTRWANLDFGIEYQELPGVENRGPKWFFIAQESQDRWNGAQLDGRKDCAIDSKFFMYREDGSTWLQFTYCQLVDILENGQNFNPPFTRSETRNWFNTYGKLFCYGISGTCRALLFN